MMIYSTATGIGGHFADEKKNLPKYKREVVEYWCFVCNRPTDHTGEHEGVESRIGGEIEYAECVVISVYIGSPSFELVGSH